MYIPFLYLVAVYSLEYLFEAALVKSTRYVSLAMSARLSLRAPYYDDNYDIIINKICSTMMIITNTLVSIDFDGFCKFFDTFFFMTTVSLTWAISMVRVLAMPM